MNLKQAQFALDTQPIEEDCPCTTCKNYTRAYLHHIVRQETVACHLISIHNVNFQVFSNCFPIRSHQIILECILGCPKYE